MSAVYRTDKQALIELRGVTKVYGSGQAAMHALRGIDLCIAEGEFVAVMGASGSGKSTCMNIIGCLDLPTSGRYEFCGIDVGALDADQLSLLRRHLADVGVSTVLTLLPELREKCQPAAIRANLQHLCLPKGKLSYVWL